MFTISLVALLIAVVALSTVAYFGILKYSETTYDTDSVSTVKDLNRILIFLIAIILASTGIMGYAHYMETPENVKSVQIEGN